MSEGKAQATGNGLGLSHATVDTLLCGDCASLVDNGGTPLALAHVEVLPPLSTDPLDVRQEHFSWWLCDGCEGPAGLRVAYRIRYVPDAPAHVCWVDDSLCEECGQ